MVLFSLFSFRTWSAFVVMHEAVKATKLIAVANVLLEDNSSSHLNWVACFRRKK
jgi:hypothetical protein